jgi:hypothetical protein
VRNPKRARSRTLNNSRSGHSALEASGSRGLRPPCPSLRAASSTPANVGADRAADLSLGLTRPAQRGKGRSATRVLAEDRCGPRHVAPLLAKALALLAAADRARRQRFPVRSTRGL